VNPARAKAAVLHATESASSVSSDNAVNRPAASPS
jgi:hypothetical protein